MVEKSGSFSKRVILVVLISMIAYAIMAYFVPRDSFSILLLCFSLLFVAYLFLYHHAGEKFTLKHGYLLGMGFRLIFLFATPALSDDFYRFVWDGKLLVHGINPFSYLPQEIVSRSENLEGLDEGLYSQLNSPAYYSVYPPFSQLIFYLAAFFSGASLLLNIIWIRIFILIAEVITLYFLPKLLSLYNLPEKTGLLYVLNPLVILELTGNLHFEAFMICFITLCFYHLEKQRMIVAATCFGLAVIAKLIPLILLPLIVLRLRGTKAVIFSTVVFLLTSFSFLPFLSGFPGFGESLSLYFQKFEFNGSIYFLLREVGFWIAGFNLIYWLGKALAVFSILIILRYAWIKRSSHQGIPYLMMWTLLYYLLLATTVHPWYIAPLVFLSVFTTYKFPILWSALIFLTYFQYQTGQFQENLYIVWVEYLTLFAAIWYESSYQKLKYI